MKIAIVKALDNGSFIGSGKVWVEDSSSTKSCNGRLGTLNN